MPIQKYMKHFQLKKSLYPDVEAMHWDFRLDPDSHKSDEYPKHSLLFPKYFLDQRLLQLDTYIPMRRIIIYIRTPDLALLVDVWSFGKLAVKLVLEKSLSLNTVIKRNPWSNILASNAKGIPKFGLPIHHLVSCLPQGSIYWKPHPTPPPPPAHKRDQPLLFGGWGNMEKTEKKRKKTWEWCEMECIGVK
jgi:hypothetical protein